MNLRSTDKFGFWTVAMFVIAGSGFAQALPEGPGSKAVARVCGNCHGIEVFAAARKSPDEWDKTINQMIQRGLQITDDDYQTVLEYLGKYMGKTPPKDKFGANGPRLKTLTKE
jgi:hypothetical protein